MRQLMRRAPHRNHVCMTEAGVYRSERGTYPVRYWIRCATIAFLLSAISVEVKDKLATNPTFRQQ
jgi:hypothetical protein